MRESMPWVVAAGAAALFGLAVATGITWSLFILSVIGLALVFYAIAFRMRTEADGHWLVRWVLLAFAAKVVGTLGRFFMVTVLYGTGDSIGYYEAGRLLAGQFKLGYFPPFPKTGSFGTHIIEYFTGLLFTIHVPRMVEAFLLFSMFAFAGQLLFYAAFRRWARPAQLKTYAFFVFFMPTYWFWPSSLGKDALVVFAIGGASYFISRLLAGYEVRWLLGMAIFLGILGLIRIHVVGLLVLGLLGAGVLGRVRGKLTPSVAARRLVTLGGLAAAGLLVVTIFPEIFGVDLTASEGLEAFTSDVVRRTSEAGTVASGGAVNGPEDVPGAIALVLFRPFAFEASELQHFFAAAETTLLLGVTLWKLPAMMRNRKAWRLNAYVVFSTFYVLGFSVAFSVIRNLGIIARQRGQVLALFLAILVGLGWADRGEESTAAVTVPREWSGHRARQRAGARAPAR